MTEGGRSWRGTDLLAVLGILMLLLWAPAYLAADPLEREVSSGFTFTTPMPREGDLAQFSIFVTLPDDTRHEVGPVLRIEHRAVVPGEVEVPAVFVQERTYFGGNLSVGPFEYDAEPRVVREYYDASGRPVWSSSEGRVWVWPPGVESKEQIPLDLTVARRPLLVSGLTEQSGRTITHVASPVDALAETLRVEFTWDDSSGIPPTVVSGETGRFRDLTLHAAEDGVERFLQGLTDQLLLTDDSYYGCTGIQGFYVHDVRFRVREWTRCDTYAASWFAREAPFAMGAQHRIEGINGEELIVDLLPVRFDRGTGPEHQVQPATETWLDMVGRSPFAQRLAPDPHRADRPVVMVGDLLSDRRAVVENVTLRDVREWIVEGTEGDFSAALRTSHLIGFSWKDEGTGSSTVPRDPLGPLTLLPQEIREESVVTHQHRFHLVFGGSDGTVRAATANVTLDPAGRVLEHEADASPRCGVRPCVGIPFVDPTLAVTDPFALLEEARRESMPSYFYWAPYYNGSHMAPAGFGIGGPSFHGHELVFAHHWENDAIGVGTGGGLAAWQMVEEYDPETGRAFGSRAGTLVTYDLGSGFENTRIAWSREPQGPPPGPTALAAATASEDHVEIVGWIPVGVASGGLVLIVVSLAFRVLGAMKSGLHYPFIAALYAKIAKDAVLEQEKRQEIVSLLDADPGLTLSEVQRRLGYGFGTTVHHLETLHRNGFLTTVQHGRKRHYFTAAVKTGAGRLAYVVARDPKAALLLDALRAHPGATGSELEARLSLGRTTISRTASRLAKMGLVEKRREHNRVTLWVAER